MAADDVARHGHTHRLDLVDPTVRDFTATVVAVDPERGIVLDRVDVVKVENKGRGFRRLRVRAS